MLTPDDRRAIEGLFDRLAEAGQRNPERDAEAEELIESEMSRQPGSPYYMAQTIVVQQQALEAAEQRILALEAKVAERERGGLFGGLFDDGRGRQNTAAQRQVPPAARGPWDRPDEGQRSRIGGGGFLAGAAQTALGVAGGVMLGSAIGSLLGAGATQAAENSNEQPDQTADDPGTDDPGADDFGGHFGDGGGFDMGGDF